MAPLTDRLYEALYRKPLRRFFQEYWKDEAAVDDLLQEVKRRISVNPEEQEKLLAFVNADRNLQAAFMASLMQQEDFIIWLQKQPSLLTAFINQLLETPALAKPMLDQLAEQEVLQKRFYGWLKTDSEHVRRFVIFLEKDEVLKDEFVKFTIQRKLVDRDTFIRWINHDESHLESYIQFLRNNPELNDRFYAFLLQVGVPQEILPGWLNEDENRFRNFLMGYLETDNAKQQLIQAINRDEAFSSLLMEAIVANHGKWGRLIDTIKEDHPQLAKQMVRDFLGAAKPIEQFFAWLRLEEGNQRRFLAELRSNDVFREELFQLLQIDVELRDAFNQTMWQDVGIVNDFLDYLGEDAEKRKAFLRELNARESYRSALNIMHEKEITSALHYALPTVTSSFPRSGSNFFQSVLRGSSGLQCLSLYHPQYPMEQVYNLKSHALTPDDLAREFSDMVPYETEFPQKIVYLKRDPRDVMISLYDFACFNHQQAFPMEVFLGMNYYYIANPPGKRDVKTIFYLPGPEACTVAQAYRLFTQAHFQAPAYPTAVETLLLSYEGMVEEPQDTFQQAFDFLDLDCTLNPEFIRLKVSLYSDSKRQRGIAYGWRQPENQELYLPLIEQVNDLLAEEIEFLGYGDS